MLTPASTLFIKSRYLAWCLLAGATTISSLRPAPVKSSNLQSEGQHMHPHPFASQPLFIIPTKVHRRRFVASISTRPLISALHLDIHISRCSLPDYHLCSTYVSLSPLSYAAGTELLADLLREFSRIRTCSPRVYVNERAYIWVHPPAELCHFIEIPSLTSLPELHY